MDTWPPVAMPAQDIVMAGDVPIGPFPIDIPTPPGLPIPHVGNPLPIIQQDLQYTWDDVSHFVTGIWHAAVGDVKAVVNFDLGVVQNLIDVAISVEQTAWANFISQLQDWIVAATHDIADTVNLIATTARGIDVSLFDYITGAIDNLRADVFGAIAGIEGNVLQDLLNIEHGIDAKIAGVEAWAIDNIYSPLLKDVEALGVRTLDGLVTVLDDAEAYARTLTHEETLKRIAAIAGLVTAVAAITTWIDDCGEPMCQQLGPKTDLGKLLKALNLAADALLLTELATLTETQIVQMLTTIALHLGTLVDDVESQFVIRDQTLASVVASELSRFASAL